MTDLFVILGEMMYQLPGIYVSYEELFIKLCLLQFLAKFGILGSLC